MDEETHNTYDALAQMMENWKMSNILDIFAEKLMLNFVFCNSDN